MVIIDGSCRPQLSSGRIGQHRAKVVFGERNKMTTMTRSGGEGLTTRLSGCVQVVADDALMAEKWAGPRKNGGRGIRVSPVVS